MGSWKVLVNNSLLWLGLFILGNGLSELNAQGNCLQYPDDSGERKACELCYKNEYKQGSRASLMLFDSAIVIGPNYAWAYYEKSVPYFKRGYLSQGVQILNKAIAIDPQSYLCYRAYWYHQHKSYRSCIKDLKLYYSKYGGYVEFTPGGEHEMRMLLGMSYAAIGDLDSAIRVISDYLNNPKNEMHQRVDDFYVLGVLYYRNLQYSKAADALTKQIEINPKFADSYYYLGLVREAQSNQSAAGQAFTQAEKRYNGELGGYTRNVLGIISSKIALKNRIEGKS